MEKLKYLLIDHPSIVSFRWSPTQSWGSTWWFLVSAISFYITAAVALHLLLKLFNLRRPIPLGPIPAIHSLAMTLISTTIFTGMFFSAEAEMRDTRWLWKRTRTTSFEWLLCFPLGIRPSGRVFFWSYVFYLSRLLHLFPTFFIILRQRELSFLRLFNHSIVLIMSFLWLEFSQSLQVLAILFSTVVYAVVYGYRFWTEIGLPSKSFAFTGKFRLVLLGVNLACHVGVLSLHYRRGGCNGIGAWVFNSVLNLVILEPFLVSYVKTCLQRKTTTHTSSKCEEDTDTTKHAKRNAKSKS